MEIGVGYDSLSGLVRGDCVIRTEPQRRVLTLYSQYSQLNHILSKNFQSE